MADSQDDDTFSGIFYLEGKEVQTMYQYPAQAQPYSSAGGYPHVQQQQYNAGYNNGNAYAGGGVPGSRVQQSVAVHHTQQQAQHQSTLASMDIVPGILNVNAICASQLKNSKSGREFWSNRLVLGLALVQDLGHEGRRHGVLPLQNIVDRFSNLL